MFSFIEQIIKYNFLTNALIASLLSGIALGIVGTYVVARRQVFLSGGITHSSFGGIGIAYYLGINPTLGALVFALLSAVGIEVASDRGRIREDSVIGIIWSVGMALGIIFIYLTPGYAPNLMSFLFGNILTVTPEGIYGLLALDVALVVFVTFFLRQVMFVAFDREFAAAAGVPVRTVSIVMALLTATTIVLAIRVVGIMLLISLLTIPAVIVNSFTKSYRRITFIAPLVAMAGNLAGLYAGYRLDIPAGAAAIFALAAALLVVKIVPLWGKKRRRSA